MCFCNNFILSLIYAELSHSVLVPLSLSELEISLQLLSHSDKGTTGLPHCSTFSVLDFPPIADGGWMFSELKVFKAVGEILHSL